MIDVGYKVSIIAGSDSDLDFVKPIEKIFSAENISCDTKVFSAHRNPDKLREHVINSKAEYFIALAGLAAALPGAVASYTKKPVIGVPLDGGSTSSLGGLESLLAIIQMPPPKGDKDVAVGCVAINHPEYAAKFVAKSLKIREDKNRKYDVAIKDICGVPQKELIDKLEDALHQLGLTRREDVLEGARVGIILADSYREVGKYTRDIVGEPPSQVIVVPVLSERELFLLNQIKQPIWAQRDWDGKLYPALELLELFHKMYNLAPDSPSVAVGLRRIDNAAYLANKLIGK
jgi:5-(carboxyamino)imidazole ribonucleotide mutase